MACEVPVVGSTSGNIPHLIGQTGGGATFREGDPAYLAAVLEDLIVNPKRRMELGTIGARHVSEHYTQKAVAEKLYGYLVTPDCPVTDASRLGCLTNELGAR